MSTALLTWPLLLGGWVLPEIVPAELPGAPGGSLPRPPVAASEAERGVPGPAARALPAPTAMYGELPSMPGSRGQAVSPWHAARQQVPVVPTAPDAGAPQRTAPARQAPAQIGAGINMGAGAARPPSRPFTNYEPPPVVSPFLNLERRDEFDFDNYNTLVRPFMEQRAQDLQFRNEIQSLQGTVRQRQRAFQQFEQRQQQLDVQRGDFAPGTFQDTGRFFPNR